MKKWNYYNDSDPKICAWARELIGAGLVPDGEVDNRSIADVRADDLRGFVQCHFFCGILGWALALRLAGWPDSRPAWSGSCPCQPFSAAGKQLGNSDERHLWPAWFALIEQCRPPIIFGEQVASAAVVGHKRSVAKAGRGSEIPAVSVWVDGVRADLERAQYAFGAADVPSAGVGAPNIRQRLYWLAQRLDHATGSRRDGKVHSPEGETRDDARMRVSGEGRRSGGLADSSGVRRNERWCSPGSSIQGECSERIEEQARSGQNGKLPGRSEGLCGASGLADAEHPERRPELEESGARSGRGGLGGSGGLGDAIKPGLEGHAGDGDDGHEPGRVSADTAGSAPETGELGGVGDSKGREQCWSRKSEQELRWASQTGRSGPWGDYTLIPCLDGKARRIEPGTFPLVAGLPRGVVHSRDSGIPINPQATGEARVMRLRGYGNAINPYLAAEFIRAAEEAVTL